MAKPQKSTAQSEVPGLVKKRPLYYLKRDWQLYALMLLPMVFIIVFKYFAYTGLSVAFLDYKIGKGYAGSKFVGLKIFEKVFKHRDFTKAVVNTLLLNVLDLIFSFPMPIILALLLNEIRVKWFKRTTQTLLYLPHFLSWIIVTGILHDALSGTGIVNELLLKFGILDQPLNFFAHPKFFWPIVAFANVWKETGWNAIIYLSAITSIDPSLYEAANIDGAGRWQRIRYITLPGIRPTIMILLLMNVGNVLNAGFEIQYLLGNGLVQSVAQTIDIYVLKWGISQNDFAIGTAAGIFKSFVSIVLVVIANEIAKRTGDERLF